MANFKYISCIKIAGAPILPPLILEEDRKMLAFYKERAIEVEKKLTSLKSEMVESKSSIGDIDSGGSSDIEISYNSVETSRVMDFIRQALADVGSTDVRLLQKKILEEMQNIKPPLRSASCDTLHLLEDISFSEDKVPFDQYVESSCDGNLQTELASNNSEEKLTPRQESELQDMSTNSSPCTPHVGESSVEHSATLENSQNMPNKMEDNAVISVKTPPKLIRRNSYTLDSPSPSVLLYLKSLPECKSETSSLERSKEKKVVKNLNDFWNFSVTKNERATSLENVSHSIRSSLSYEFCDNLANNGNISDDSSNFVNHVVPEACDENISSQGKQTVCNTAKDVAISITPEKEVSRCKSA
uniref:Uncharacterized protein n=1 Tax=Rhodnius prolixus TaxID=13249 RepID=T1HNR5_RHOPR